MELRCFIVMCLVFICAVSSTEATIQTFNSCGCTCGTAKGCCGNLSPKPFYECVPGLGYYKLHMNLKTWHEAKAICEKEGAHLAVVNSQEELEAMQELRRRLPNVFGGVEDDHCFLGMTYEGAWKTVTGEQLVGAQITEWVHSETNGGIIENCGFLVVSQGKLNKGPCTTKRGFFCEASCEA